MAKSASDFGFVECADLITEQHYGRALKFFQLAVSRFLESKSTPKRTEIARQLLHIGAVSALHCVPGFKNLLGARKCN